MATPEQSRRSCRHEQAYHVWAEHPKYGNKMPFVVTKNVEVPCDASCGGRVKD